MWNRSPAVRITGEHPTPSQYVAVTIFRMYLSQILQAFNWVSQCQLYYPRKAATYKSVLVCKVFKQ